MRKTQRILGLQGISRRGLLKSASVMGAAAIVAPLAATMAKAAPKKGGTLRLAFGHGSTTDTYDPGTWDQAFVQVFATARHGYLTEVAADGSLIGEVAESWDASADAATWTFKLRDGLAFHSGKSVTPEDVIASLNHHRGDDTSSAAKPVVSAINDMKIEGNAVVISLDAGNADFPFLLSDYHLPIMASADGKIDPTSSDGCGAYVVSSFEPGVVAKMTRNPNYWKADRAYFDAVEMLVIIDPVARQNALVSGEVDVIDKVDLKTVHLLKRQKGLTVLSTTGNQHYTFAMDTRLAPYDNNHVRLALKYAVDREEMVEKILNGFGSVGNDHPIGISQRYHNGDLEQHAYDPDKAKFHLKQAGLDSLDVSLSAADAAFGGAVDAGVLYSESAAKAGINITVVREPNDGYWSNVWMKKPWTAVYWGGRATEDWMFSMAYASGVAWNDTFWDHGRFNELLLAARAELDDAKRRDMYGEMQGIVSNEGGVVIPMFAAYVMAHSDKIVTPDQVGSNWTLDGFRAIERWSFA